MKDIKSAIVNIHDKTTIKISIHSSLVIISYLSTAVSVPRMTGIAQN